MEPLAGNRGIWQVCLVSDQPLPNALPALALQPELAGVTLAATPSMVQRADWLAQVLQARGVVVQRLALPDPHDLSAVRRAFEVWIAAQSGRNLLLNATGGTKTLALLAVQAFAARGLPVRYLDERKGLWLDVLGGAPAVTLPKTRLTIDEVAALHGLQVRARRDGVKYAQWLRVAQGWGKRSVDFHHALGRLRRALSNAPDPVVPAAALPRGLFDQLGAAGLLRRAGGGAVRVVTPEARKFITGDWLEDYALDCAQRALAGDELLQDCAAGVIVEQVEADRADRAVVDNELDLVMLHNGILFVVECKSGSVSEKLGTPVDDLYKLAFQARVGGHTTRLALLHLGKVTPAVQERARWAKIALWTAADLPALDQRLRDWMASASN